MKFNPDRIPDPSSDQDKIDASILEEIAYFDATPGTDRVTMTRGSWGAWPFFDGTCNHFLRTETETETKPNPKLNGGSHHNIKSPKKSPKFLFLGQIIRAVSLYSGHNLDGIVVLGTQQTGLFVLRLHETVQAMVVPLRRRQKSPNFLYDGSNSSKF